MWGKANLGFRFLTDLPSLWKRSRIALLKAMRKSSKVAESDPNLARKLTIDNNHKNVTYLGTVDSGEIAYTPCFAVLDRHEIPLVPRSAVLTCGPTRHSQTHALPLDSTYIARRTVAEESRR